MNPFTGRRAEKAKNLAKFYREGESGELSRGLGVLRSRSLYIKYSKQGDASGDGDIEGFLGAVHWYLGDDVAES